MKRQYNSDGYYIIKKTDNYPGMIAKHLNGDREIVVMGDPEINKQVIEDHINNMIVY